MARIGLSLQQSMGQHQLLLPRMLQSVEVLQLPATELEAWLHRAAEDNEALALEGPSQESRGEAPTLRRKGTREDSERHDQMLRNQPARAHGQTENLEEQLALLDLDQAVLDWARFLISCIDTNGYLSAGDATLLALAEEGGLTGGEAALERGLGVLRGLEPRGIGARNAIDALVLQLDRDDPQYDLLLTLLEDFLEDVARNKLPGVARAMGLSVGELQRLIDRLGELDPRPAAQLSDESAPVLHPDVLVERDGDGFEVRVESAGLPSVKIDEDIAHLAKDKHQTADVRRYLRKKIDRARWVCEAVEQRGRTLLRIASKTFEHQRAFLEHGPGHLAPLRMNQLADELDIHVSTVSRAVAGKYAQTPFGILPLRYFFQSSAGAGAGAGEGTARDDVRSAVREIFEREDRSQPLSDDEVVEQLAGSGIDLARRTVAKYRKELGIPSSYRRRKYE
jgi:RNA polymerase sigma-54 factor